MRDYYDKEEIKPEDMPYVVVDTIYGNGVYAGFFAGRGPEDKHVILEDARQVFDCDCRGVIGIACDGPLPSHPAHMSPIVERMEIIYPREVFTCTAEARDAILNCPNRDGFFEFRTVLKKPKGVKDADGE